MDFRVNSTVEAERDLDEILAWLLSNSAGETGLRWLDGLQDAISSLAHNPRRCALAPEAESPGVEVRHLLYGNKPHVYRILFTIEGHVVTVIHVRHGRRLPLIQQ